MGDIIVFFNQKGGVGKTTSASNVALWLTELQYKTAIVDLDASCDLTSSVGVDLPCPGILDLLSGENADSLAFQTDFGHLIPGSPRVLEPGLFDGMKLRLWEAVGPLAASFDFVILDSPPTVCEMSVAAIEAATHLVIPVQADPFSLSGVDYFIRILAEMMESVNPGLSILGILLTRYKPRLNISRGAMEVLKGMALSLRTTVFETFIRENVALTLSQMRREGIIFTAPRSAGAADYREVTLEILDRLKK
jgi:chromosome partitioning protein